MEEFETQQGGVPVGDVELNTALKRGIQKFDVLNSWLHENEIHFSDLHIEEGNEVAVRTSKGYGPFSVLFEGMSYPGILAEKWEKQHFIGLISQYRSSLLSGSGLVGDSLSFPSAQRVLFERIQEGGGALDFPIATEKARYRVNMYYYGGRQKLGIAARRLNTEVPAFDSLSLPEPLKHVCMKQKGLVLVTGPTGSGKSTTLAAMLDFINANQNRHIISIEDPIEYVHHSKKSVMTQREVGVDADSFKSGVVAAMRQDPDVILVGEIRDRETAEAALSAANTGHLVFSTLHTNSAEMTCNRIMGFFTSDDENRILDLLSSNLLCTTAQVLAPRADGEGKVMICELMLQNDEVRSNIFSRNFKGLENAILSGKDMGMMFLNAQLEELVHRGVITRDTALSLTTNEADMRFRLSAE